MKSDNPRTHTLSPPPSPTSPPIRRPVPLQSRSFASALSPPMSPASYSHLHPLHRSSSAGTTGDRVRSPSPALSDSFIVVQDGHSEQHVRDGSGGSGGRGDVTEVDVMSNAGSSSTLSTALLAELEMSDSDASSDRAGTDSLAGSLHLSDDLDHVLSDVDVENEHYGHLRGATEADERGLGHGHDDDVELVEASTEADLSNLGGSYADAEATASIITHSDTKSTLGADWISTHSSPQGPGRGQGRGRSDRSAKDIATYDPPGSLTFTTTEEKENDTDNTPGGSRIEFIFPNPASSFSTLGGSSNFDSDTTTPTGSQVGLLRTRPKSGSINKLWSGKVEKDKEAAEVEVGVEGRYLPFVPSVTSSLTLEKLEDASLEKVKYSKDKTGRREREMGKIPDGWLKDARIWAPYSEELDGTRSEVPDYEVLASRETLDEKDQDNEDEDEEEEERNGERRSDRGLKGTERGRQEERFRRVLAAAAGATGRHKRWGLIALASVISVVLLGTLGPGLSLSTLSHLSPRGSPISTTPGTGRSTVPPPPVLTASSSRSDSSATSIIPDARPRPTASSGTSGKDNAYMPRTLATQLIPDINAIRHALSTLSLPVKNNRADSDSDVKGQSQGGVASSDPSSTSVKASNAGAKRKGKKASEGKELAETPLAAEVAVAVSNGNGYKNWAAAIAERVRKDRYRSTTTDKEARSDPDEHHGIHNRQGSSSRNPAVIAPRPTFSWSDKDISAYITYHLIDPLISEISREIAELKALASTIIASQYNVSRAMSNHLSSVLGGVTRRTKSAMAWIKDFEDDRERKNAMALRLIKERLGMKWAGTKRGLKGVAERDRVVLGKLVRMVRSEGGKVREGAMGVVRALGEWSAVQEKGAECAGAGAGGKGKRSGSGAKGKYRRGCAGKRDQTREVESIEKPRLDPWEITMIRDQWVRMENGVRSKWRRFMDVLHHGVIPFVLA